MAEIKVCTRCGVPASSPTAQFCRGCGSKLETVSAAPKETKTSAPMLFGSGTPDVEKMKEKRDVEGLIKALGYEKNSDVRKNVAEALGEIGDARAVEPLIRADYDPDPTSVSYNAEDALHKIGEPAVEPLIILLNDADSRVRFSATWALGAIGDRRAVKPLRKALNDTNEGVSEGAAQALYKIQHK